MLLAEKLNASVSSDWPSGEYDRDAMEFFLSCFEKGGELAEGWYGWYAINITVSGERTLVGSGGYFGPPDSNGIVEIGYSVLPSWQCRGYATEIVNMLISHACSFEETNSIIAHTAPENIASKKVLISNGFREVAMNDGMLSFEYTR
ncbi:GNAT family N-acetyltransferase [Colwellia hornerae]|uniref:GNAT family N-acetyltransferase n=1 Tax=Colwellia hornerae TaxID=89402 RepID=UPI001CB991F7|nr:GNAT family N-acetyltransferase [Colwellia hornerae]